LGKPGTVPAIFPVLLVALVLAGKATVGKLTVAAVLLLVSPFPAASFSATFCAAFLEALDKRELVDSGLGSDNLRLAIEQFLSIE
jgi:hypothetical protein